MLMLVMQMLYTCYIHVICYICYITYDICYIQSATVCSTGPRPAQGMLQFPKKLGHCFTLPLSLDIVSKGFCLFVLIHVVPGFLAILRPEQGSHLSCRQNSLSVWRDWGMLVHYSYRQYNAYCTIYIQCIF